MLPQAFSVGVILAWAGACLKVVFVFCAIVMVRVCTPRFGLGAIGRLAWGSTFVYVCAFFLFYTLGLLWV